MACPACGCKTTYPYCGDSEDHDPGMDNLERCAACGHMFDIKDHADEDDDHDG